MKRFHIAALAALAAAWALPVGTAAAAATPPQIHTVAGGGSCTTPIVPTPPPGTQPTALPCSGAKATSVPIVRARSVAGMPGGAYLYVDEGDGLVQQVSSGTVTTVAGGGSSCDYSSTNPPSCDGMPATSVKLDDPVGVAALPDGGFLVTEYAGQRVLTVSPGPPGTATITTVAGTGKPARGPDNGVSGPATTVPLNYPTDAEPTADGGVLIANSAGNDIWYVAPSGSMSIVAGGGTTCPDSTSSCDGVPASQVAVDQPASVSPIQGGSEGFLIAEYGGDAVRHVSQISGGTFTTVAGTPGQPGFGGDGGPATAALLDQPEQVLSTPDGGFFIADAGNEVIRQVSGSGMITTVAGTPQLASYAGDGGPAASASLFTPVAVAPTTNGGLLIADQDNNVIREITLPPVSTISLNPSAPNGANGWYTSSVTATVSATESATFNCILDPPAAPPAFGAMSPGCSFTGSGGTISGNGVHYLYSASMNSFGDQEVPVDAVVKIDTSPPTLTCNGHPSFPAGSRNAIVTATVTDPVSGPVAPIVSARANTSHVGVHRATLAGMNNAGIVLNLTCSYTVLPVRLKPSPSIQWKFAVTGSTTTIRRLVVSDVAAGAAVNVTCTGTGCPFHSARNVTGAICRGKPCTATSKLRRRRPTVDLTALFAHARLGVGTRLSVSVTKTNTIGGVWRFTTRTGKVPARVAGCLEPGSSVPDKGCKP